VKVDIYPVGVLHDIKRDRALRKIGRRRPWVRSTAKRIGRNAKVGDWRGIRTMFNGHLAEIEPWPVELRKCGRGWTEKAALRDLNRKLRRAGLSAVNR
jgi:hypothetical protein